MAKHAINNLLNRDMSRKEFLANSGAAFLAVVGVAGLLKAVGEFGQPKRGSGYGSAGYGGDAESRRAALQSKNRIG